MSVHWPGEPSIDWSSVRVVLFDAVGTVIHPHPEVADVYQRIGASHGFERDRTVIQERFRAAVERHYPPHGGTSETLERQRWQNLVAEVFDSDIAHTADLFQALWQHFAAPEHWAVDEPVVACWELMREPHRKLGIASNFDQRLKRIARSLLPLHDDDPVFCSTEIGFSKPHPGFFGAIERQLMQIGPEILLIGDDPQRDLAAALSAGWQAILVQDLLEQGESS